MRETRSRMSRSTCRTLATLPAALAAVALLASDAQAQRRPVRRTQPIEIRGQVPTPQVVMVRPREVPQYNRRVLVPDFYDHDFWPAILPGYQLVSRRLVTGNSRLDSLTAPRADSVQMADSTRRAAMGRAAIGVGLLTRPQLRAPAAPGVPGDTTRRPLVPGTPADTARPPQAAPVGTPPASGRR